MFGNFYNLYGRSLREQKFPAIAPVMKKLSSGKTWIRSTFGCALLAIIGTGVASQVHAQEGIHPYLGASYGLYKSGDGDYDEDRDLWEVYAGIGLHRFFGIEANYTHIGRMSNDFSEVEIDGWGAAVVGQLPITDTFDVYAKVGQFFWDADVEGLGFSETIEDEELFFTIGAGLGITELLSLTLEYTRFNTELELEEITNDSDSGDLDTVKAGLRFAF